MLLKYLNAFWEHDVQATGDGESTAAHGPSRHKVSARLGGAHHKSYCFVVVTWY